MAIDPPVVALILIIATVLLWAAAIILGRVDGRVTARGLRNGALIATALFAITAVIVALVFNGRAVFLVTLDLAGAIELGLLVGLVVGLGYLWLGSVLIAIGLIFKSKPQWTTLGAWAAVPVVVMAAGFGYASYKSVTSEGAAASSANGSMHLNLCRRRPHQRGRCRHVRHGCHWHGHDRDRNGGRSAHHHDRRTTHQRPDNDQSRCASG